MVEMVDVIDEKGAFLRTVSRKEAKEKGLLHKTVYVVITDYFGKFLVQKRSMSKDVFPGYWDLGVSETVLAGESYEEAAVRGLAEEIGVSGFSINELSHLFDFTYRSPSYNKISRVYKMMYNGKIELQVEEIDEIRHMTRQEVLDLISSGVFAEDGAAIFSKLIGEAE